MDVVLDFVEELLANAFAIALRRRSEELLQVVEGQSHVLYRNGYAFGIDLRLKLAKLVELHGLQGVAAIIVHLLVEVHDLTLVDAGLGEIAEPNCQEDSTL